MFCESKIMYEVKLWGLDETWKDSGKIHGQFCKKRNTTTSKIFQIA